MNLLQVSILKALLCRENWDTLNTVLEDEWFGSTVARKMYTTIGCLHGESTGDISISTLKMYIESTFRIKVGVRDELLELADVMGAAEDHDPQELKRLVMRFRSRSLSMKAMEHLGIHMDEDDYDPSIPAGLLTQAAEMSISMDADVVDYHTAVSPADNIRTGVIGYGFSDKFDSYLDGGKGPGELSICVALSGIGKTSMLLLDAAKAAKAGRKVLYITKEIRAAKCIQRIDQCYTLMDKYEMTANPARVMAARERVPGRIWVKDWSHTKTTVSDIRSLILQMKQRGDDVDYLVVDYMKLLEPEMYNRVTPRLNHTAVCKDLRALGNELGIPVSTAWQAKRLATGKLYLEKDDIEEDWGVVGNADIIIGLNQNNEELRDKVMRINIIKQRESTCRNTMHLYADLDRMIVREQSAYEEPEMEEAS